jgi:hypothetical protein
MSFDVPMIRDGLLDDMLAFRECASDARNQGQDKRFGDSDLHRA